MTERYDVIVAGGGIMGCSVAWQLARRGKRVLVVERRDIASGSAGATDGVVGYHTKKPGPQMDLAVQSIALFDTLGQELGEDVEYGLRCGGLQPVEDKMQWDILSAIVEKQRESGVDIRMISPREACALEPQLTHDIYGALYSPTGGKVNPLKLTMAYARAARRLGAEFLTETAVTGFLTEDGRITGVRTERGDFAADAVVNAAGSWAGRVAGLAGLDLPITPRKGQLIVTEPIGPFLTATVQCARYNVVKFRPEAVTDPTAIRLGASLSIEQNASGGLIIGGTREFAGYDGDNTFEAVEAMLRRALRFFPALRDVSVIRCFAGFRPYTPDGLPLLGPVQAAPGLWMAAGHEGDGIALAPITGKLIAEWIVDGAPSYSLSDFSPDRFLTAAGKTLPHRA